MILARARKNFRSGSSGIAGLDIISMHSNLLDLLDLHNNPLDLLDWLELDCVNHEITYN